MANLIDWSSVATHIVDHFLMQDKNFQQDDMPLIVILLFIFANIYYNVSAFPFPNEIDYEQPQNKSTKEVGEYYFINKLANREFAKFPENHDYSVSDEVQNNTNDIYRTLVKENTLTNYIGMKYIDKLNISSKLV